MAGNPFVEEIDANEIKFEGIVGKGSFGTVVKGKWRNIDVAVKLIQTDQEKKAFIVEVKQLSRVDHCNIVKLHGACTKGPEVFLVMEYAEGGSLYNVLHCMKQVEYTAAHAISWLLQTASGVAYLHNMKPRPLIHRDLKPPNLLLINGGTVLKICDFGTACDMQTNMTNSKGSAAWMAPEVFEGSQYSEKCDVFSWAIILWEVLSRKKPFHDGEGATAFRIMWAVHNGKRPPLIQGCPKPLEDLMVRCWDMCPSVRPSMTEAENEIGKIFQLLKGADQPITFLPQESNVTMETSSSIMTGAHRNGTGSSGSKTVLPEKAEMLTTSNIVNTSDTNFLNVEDAGEKYVKDIKKRRSADFSNTDVKLPSNLGHRRTGSCDSPCVKAAEPRPVTNVGEILNEVPSTSERRRDSYVMNERMNEVPHGGQYFLILEPRLQPLQPIQNCQESKEIYDKHLALARELICYRSEIALLTERRDELKSQLQDRDNSSTYIEEYVHLKKEKEGLLELRQNLKRQLEIIRSKQQGKDKANGDEWVMV
ncbi:mitogen-activated protein kinase kinase kinase 7-like [Uloborus diversus]|uniref:mitogen-activated protein kinase kinase kinase 7-like n=1 Tax=Uloborus diversus TaxID=327109 RepID=UPI002409BDC6|nr:mitogen-activated protein kinase kinase kinase 7-like [Uloborus diversus]